MVADFMHSDKLKAMLEQAQEEKLRPLGIPGDRLPMATVMKNFGFAKQRFDSTVDPAAKLALVLLPMCTVLAILASDSRNVKERRDNAARAIKYLDTKFATALGISADWGIVWEVLLRLFDRNSHDIAASSSQVEAHIKLLKALFLEGGVFDSRTWNMPMVVPEGDGDLPPVIQGCMQDAGVQGAFISSYVSKQVAYQCEFNVAGRPVSMWGPLGKSEQQEVGERVRNATVVAIERLEADMLGPDGIRGYLGCFHMPAIRAACKPNCQQRTASGPWARLIQRFKNIWQRLKLPYETLDAAAIEYQDLAKHFAKVEQAPEKSLQVDSRHVWSLCLDPTYLRQAFKGRSAPIQHVPQVVRFWFAIIDGTVEVERDHSAIRGFETNRGKQMDLAMCDDVMVISGSHIKLDDVATKEGAMKGDLGPFGRDCARLWRKAFGARLGIGRSLGCKLKAKKSSYQIIKKGVLKASGGVLRRPDKHLQTNAFRLGSVGPALGVPTPGRPGNPFWNKGCIYDSSNSPR